MKQQLRFPEKFLWGAATASYQVEGGIENCDWAEGAREGRVPKCGAACDHYNRYETDFDNAQKLGHNAHRISLEWARIEPEEGKFDLAEVAHYKNVINSLRARGLEPFVTLWHFTLPLWFSHDDGFENKKSVERFARYAEFCAREILGEVKFIQTINEPMVWSSEGYLKGNWPPFKKNIIQYVRVVNNLIKAHQNAYSVIKKFLPESKVGIAKNQIYFEATLPDPFNIFRARFSDWWWNRRFLNYTKDKLDFIGLNHYTYVPFGIQPDLPRTVMGWYIHPLSIYQVLIELKQYHLPIYITENGIADATDGLRKDFITSYLKQVHQAITHGTDVRGYLHWSLLDNYEWAFGFEKKFGLIEVDLVTQERRIRPSAFVYKNICESNVLEIGE